MKTKVLAITMEYIPSFNLGVKAPLEYLANQNLLELRYNLSRNITTSDIDWCDVIVATRFCTKDELDILVYAKQCGKYICSFMDDDLLNIPVGLAGNSYFRTQNAQELVRGAIGYTDCLWSSNKLILDKYSYLVTKTALVDGIALLLDTKTKTKINQNIVKIGFSGGAVHTHTLEKILCNVYRHLNNKYNNLYFEFFGALPEFAKSLNNVKHIKAVSDYDEYKQIMSNLDWDIGVAPLEYSEFSACKYHNKFMEYGSCYIPAVYSNVPPFNLVIEHDKTGLLANSEQEWIDCIERFITSTELRKNIADNARNFIENHNTKEAIQQQLLSQINELTTFKTKTIKYSSINAIKENRISIEQSKLKIYIHKAFIEIKLNKFKGIYTVIKKALIIGIKILLRKQV